MSVEPNGGAEGGVDVLLIAFARPDLLAQVVERLRNAPVRTVYLALDGPRDDRSDDLALIEECERLTLESFEGIADIKVLRRATNLGMRAACVGAIDWFFDHTAAGVIIEDDCVPEPSFLRFASELLERFHDDEQVMAICGMRHPDAPPCPAGAPYSLTRTFGVWGWATWARAWQHNDVTLADADDATIRTVLAGLPGATVPFKRWWLRLLRGCRDGRNLNWDFPWVFAAWRRGGLFIVPDRNLVSNIGHDGRATQTTGLNPRLSALPTTPMAFPLQHPSMLLPDLAYARWTDWNLAGVGWALEAKTIIRRALDRFQQHNPQRVQ
jgi:hypothetical protein